MGDASIPQPTALIFGGNGKTARQLTTILRVDAETPHTIFSVIRNPDQIPDLEAIGANPIVQDISTGTEADFIKIIEHTRPDVVVWAAGGKDPKSAEAVDRDGAIRVMDALSKATVTTKRYVVVSALDIRDRDNKPVPDWYTEADEKLSERMWNIIGPVLQAKLAADTELRVGNTARKLNYTIVRPGGLTEGLSTGKVRAGKVGIVGMITREDVARVIYAVMHNKKTHELAFDVLGPTDESLTIEEAVSRVADKHEDTFEGYY